MILIMNLFILIPIVGFIINVLLNKKDERFISGTAFAAVGMHLMLVLMYSGYFLITNSLPINIKEISLFTSKEYDFFLDFYFDKVSMVYLLVGSFLVFLVTRYSRFYMHREPGFKRFFNTLLFFFIGYNITVLAGNFETLFIGWEILGITSFLLIAFYRDRYLPVKNANKVFSVYRIGDIGLILAMWASHHLWHENITFMKLHNAILVSEHLEQHSFVGMFISISILIAAAAKSAQLPFSSWLPRAMEGPTPSSAIFYGSLSVHLGAFLLMRTFPFWENQTLIRVLIGLLGLSTSIIALFIARVQSTVKSQIAYASVSQIGIIFIEIAFGFQNLALIHFAGNAFLRTYQLLISPSVVSYLIREQFFNFKANEHTFEDTLSKKIEYSLYLLSLKEWNLDLVINYIIWKPMKRVGELLNFLTFKKLIYLFVPSFLVGMLSLWYTDLVPPYIINFLPIFYGFLSLIMVIKSFSERKYPLLSWALLSLNHLWISLAISFNEHFEFIEVVFYLSGVIVFSIVGYFSLSRLQQVEKKFNLNAYYGHAYEHPAIAFVFFIACLGVMGFPISPTFIGIDLVFSHVHEDQIFLAFFVASSYIIGGIAAIRLYSRIFLGIHYKNYHETPYKSS